MAASGAARAGAACTEALVLQQPGRRGAVQWPVIGSASDRWGFLEVQSKPLRRAVVARPLGARQRLAADREGGAQPVATVEVEETLRF